MTSAHKLALGGLGLGVLAARRGLDEPGGVDDGEVLEANQIIGYFNYVNRCLNGLGVTTEGDIVGYYSSSDAS